MIVFDYFWKLSILEVKFAELTLNVFLGIERPFTVLHFGKNHGLWAFLLSHVDVDVDVIAMLSLIQAF